MGKYLTFTPITLVPFEPKLINYYLLSPKQVRLRHFDIIPIKKQRQFFEHIFLIKSLQTTKYFIKRYEFEDNHTVQF